MKAFALGLVLALGLGGCAGMRTDRPLTASEQLFTACKLYQVAIRILKPKVPTMTKPQVLTLQAARRVAGAICEQTRWDVPVASARGALVAVRAELDRLNRLKGAVP